MPNDPTDPSRIPSPRAMRRAAEALQANGDVRKFIHLVESWRDVGEVPSDLQLAQVASLLDLCQTDRAWVRLKDLVEIDDPEDEALMLAARMFIQRGWPGRAQLPLQILKERRPDDDDVLDLIDDANLPNSLPDEPPADSTSVGLLLPLAEAHLSQGNRLKGQSLLERLRRAHPDHTRVQDLLWALDAEWGRGEEDLAALILSSDTITPAHPRRDSDLADLDDEDEDELTDIGVEPNPVTLVSEADEEDDPDFAFPALFRGSGKLGAGHQGTPISPPRRSLFDDVTESTNLADLDALNEAVGAARRAAGMVGGDEFTEIRRVIRRPDGTPELEESVDSTIPDTAFARGPVDGNTPRHTGSSLDVDVEAEDDALIIVTKRERDEDDAELLELDPNTESVAHPDAARFLAEAEQLEREAEREAEQARLRQERERAIAEARSSQGSHVPLLGMTPGWIGAAIVVMMAVVVMLIGLLIVLYGLS